MPLVNYDKYLISGSSYYPNSVENRDSYSYNFIANDTELLALPSYHSVDSLIKGKCRGVYYYSLIEANIVVIQNIAYIVRITISNTISIQQIGHISDNEEAVSIAGNNREEILIVSDSKVYYYDIKNRVFSELAIENCNPIYVSYNLAQFILTDSKNNEWRLSDISNSTSFPINSSHVLPYSDNSHLKAIVSHNLETGVLLLLSDKKCQFWASSAVKPDQFPYFLIGGSDSAYGCVTNSTIVAYGHSVVWLTQDDLNRYSIAVANLKRSSISLFDVNGLSDYLSDNCKDEVLLADRFIFYNSEYYVLHLLNKGISLLIDFNGNWFHLSQDYFFQLNENFVLDKQGIISKIMDKNELNPNKQNPQKCIRIVSPLIFDSYKKIKNFRLRVSSFDLKDDEDNQIILNYSKNAGLSYFGTTRVFLNTLNKGKQVHIRRNSLGLSRYFSVKLEVYNRGFISLNGSQFEVI